MFVQLSDSFPTMAFPFCGNDPESQVTKLVQLVVHSNEQ